MEEYTNEQIKIWKEKAEKWDNLAKRIDKAYMDEDGNLYEDGDDRAGDLISIGQDAAIAFGWL